MVLVEMRTTRPDITEKIADWDVTNQIKQKNKLIWVQTVCKGYQQMTKVISLAIFSDLAKESGAHHSDDLFSSISMEAVSRKEKIHRMHILKMRLTYFVNSLHNYIMTRVR